MFGWKKEPNPLSGVKVEGDKAMPPTRWWNHLYLLLWGWRTVVVFSVPDEVARAGYFIGFTDFRNRSKRETKPCHDPTFILKVGHEDSTVFIRPFGPHIASQNSLIPKLERYSKLH